MQDLTSEQKLLIIESVDGRISRIAAFVGFGSFVAFIAAVGGLFVTVTSFVSTSINDRLPGLIEASVDRLVGEKADQIRIQVEGSASRVATVEDQIAATLSKLGKVEQQLEDATFSAKLSWEAAESLSNNLKKSTSIDPETWEAIFRAANDYKEIGVVDLTKAISDVSADLVNIKGKISSISQSVTALDRAELLVKGSCPSGWKSKGLVGLIMPTKGYDLSIGAQGGGLYANPDWTWIHPTICVR